MAKPLPVLKIPPKTSAHKTGLQTAVSPVATDAVYQGTDQGVDYNQATPYVAVGDGTILGIGHGWHGGTGIGLYYRLDKAITVNGRTYRDLYIAERNPVKPFQAGDRVKAGDPLTDGGAAELGFANGTQPLAKLVGGYNAQGGHTQPTQAGADFLSFQRGGHVPAPPKVPLTPAQKAAAAVTQATATATAKANNPAYLTAQDQLAQARIQGNIDVAVQTKVARATAHLNDPWITLDKNGQPVENYGPTAPKNVLLIGGIPATLSLYQQSWDSAKDSTFQAYTGKAPTAGQKADILRRGISVYQLQNELSTRPGFTTSPVYRQSAAGIAAKAKTALGRNPPAAFVRQAIVQGWDEATLIAKIRSLPAYEKGPEFKNNFAQAKSVYTQIYGGTSVRDPRAEKILSEAATKGWGQDLVAQKLRALPGYQGSSEFQGNLAAASGSYTAATGATVTPEVNQWLKHVTLQGWSNDQIAQKLRTDPAYKYSPEYQSKAVNFLDAMGLFTGTRPVASIQNPQAIQQNTQGSKVGPALNLRVGVGGQ